MDDQRYEIREDEKYFYIYDRRLDATVEKFSYRESAEKRCGVLNRNWRRHGYIVIERVK